MKWFKQKLTVDFSLLELVVVVAVIGTLAFVANIFQARFKQAEEKSNISTSLTLQEFFKIDKNQHHNGNDSLH